MKKKVVYKTALGAMLCALALVMSFLENLIPQLPLMPPGAKPGFSNIIVMFAATNLSIWYVMVIVLVKALFALITRGATAAFMSLLGGIFASLSMLIVIRQLSDKVGYVGVSVIGALFHNAGQLIGARILTGTSKILFYAPFLALFSIVTGIITGVLFSVVLPALNKTDKYFNRL